MTRNIESAYGDHNTEKATPAEAIAAYEAIEDQLDQLEAATHGPSELRPLYKQVRQLRRTAMGFSDRYRTEYRESA